MRLPLNSSADYHATASPSPWKSAYPTPSPSPFSLADGASGERGAGLLPPTSHEPEKPPPQPAPAPQAPLIQVATVDGASYMPPLTFQPHNHHFYLVGDSFAREWKGAFERITQRYNVTAHFRMHDACVWFPVQVYHPDCRDMLEPLHSEEGQPTEGTKTEAGTGAEGEEPWPSVVILISRSAEYNIVRPLHSTDDQAWHSIRSNKKLFLQYTREAIITYMDSFPAYTRFVFFHPHRSPINPGLECFKRANPAGCVAEAGYEGPLDDFRVLMDDITRTRNDTYAFNIDHFVCPHKECHGEVDGMVQFKGDGNHLHDAYVAAHEADFEKILFPLFPHPY